MAIRGTLPPTAKRGSVEDRFDPESWQSPATDFWHSVFSGDHSGHLPAWMSVDEAILAAAGVIAFDGYEALARGGGRPGGGGSGGGGTVTESYLSGDPTIADASEYNIQIDFLGTLWTDDLKADFKNAAAYLSDQIIGDLPDIYSLSLFGGWVDDIVITANLINIDGTGNVLGRAGPTYIRSDGSLPVAGTMEFDVADAATFDSAGLWKDIVQHEMLHTLGFGTLWEQIGLIDTYIDTQGTRRPADDTVDYRFNGKTANALADNSLYANDSLGIPVETDGGSGTAGGHWDEATFGSELMTGWINGGNYIAPMTIGSLTDLGYQTIYG